MRKRAKIIVNQGIILYIGKSTQSDFHMHHAMQIVLVIQGKYKFYIENEICEGSCLFIHSNITHKHVSVDGILLSILIDPETDLGNLLTANYPNSHYLFNASPDAISKLTEELFKDNSSISNIQNLITEFFELEPIKSTRDTRISSLINKISSSDITNIELEKLMVDIPLSVSRIRHLFKSQTGISIQRYILWTKIKNAFYHMEHNENLSQVAYLSGFSDYAHLSRTIKEMFGLNLKKIIKDSHYVQEM